ncbi:MAG: superinfection immunity protein [Chlorobium sp.]|nr:MAG: superinfection immunity protein [Chlorobium sp.]
MNHFCSWYCSNSSPVLSFLVMVLLSGLDFISCVVAFARTHHSKFAILTLNILLGWSGIGWIVALVWALAYPGHD